MNQRESNRTAIAAAICKKEFDQSFVETCKQMGGGHWNDDMNLKELRERFAHNGLRFTYGKTITAIAENNHDKMENALQILEEIFGKEFDIRAMMRLNQQIAADRDSERTGVEEDSRFGKETEA